MAYENQCSWKVQTGRCIPHKEPVFIENPLTGEITKGVASYTCPPVADGSAIVTLFQVDGVTGAPVGSRIVPGPQQVFVVNPGAAGGGGGGPATNVAVTNFPTDPDVAGLANLQRIVATGAGSTPAAAASISVTNVGPDDAQVAGQPLLAGETWTASAFYDPVVNTYFRLPAVAYVGSPTSPLHITVLS